MEIKRLDPGIYQLTSEAASTTSTTLTAQELRDVFEWCLHHMRQLEQEAANDQQQQPPASHGDERHIPRV